MKEWIEIIALQPPAWRVATFAVVITVFALVVGCVLAFFEELVDWAIGPVRLRLRIHQVRREQQRLAEEDEARERERLSAVIRFPVH